MSKNTPEEKMEREYIKSALEGEPHLKGIYDPRNQENQEFIKTCLGRYQNNKS